MSENLANFGEFLILTLWPNSPAAKKVLHRLLLLSRKRREAVAETELNINVLSTCPRFFPFFPAANFRGKQFRNFLFLPFRGCISGSRKVGEVKVCVHNILQDIEFHTRKKCHLQRFFFFWGVLSVRVLIKNLFSPLTSTSQTHILFYVTRGNLR